MCPECVPRVGVRSVRPTYVPLPHAIFVPPTVLPPGHTPVMDCFADFLVRRDLACEASFIEVTKPRTNNAQQHKVSHPLPRPSPEAGECVMDQKWRHRRRSRAIGDLQLASLAGSLGCPWTLGLPARVMDASCLGSLLAASCVGHMCVPGFGGAHVMLRLCVGVVVRLVLQLVCADFGPARRLRPCPPTSPAGGRGAAPGPSGIHEERRRQKHWRRVVSHMCAHAHHRGVFCGLT